MCKGDRVTWHLSGLGSEMDINSLYFEGNRFLYRQNRLDSISVFPHISHTVTMEPDSMGMLCYVNNNSIRHHIFIIISFNVLTTTVAILLRLAKVILI